MRIKLCGELGIVFAIALLIPSHQTRGVLRIVQLLVHGFAMRIHHHERLACIWSVLAPVLWHVDPDELLAGERGVVPFPVGAGAEVLRGVADAAPELDVAAVGVGLLGREEAAEAGGGVDEFGEVGWGEAFAVGDAGVGGWGGHDEDGCLGGLEGGCWGEVDGHGFGSWREWC